MYPEYLDIHTSYYIHPEILTCPKSNCKLIISFFGQQLNSVGPETRKSLHIVHIDYPLMRQFNPLLHRLFLDHDIIFYF